jgi:hypothetical protein
MLRLHTYEALTASPQLEVLEVPPYGFLNASILSLLVQSFTYESSDCCCGVGPPAGCGLEASRGRCRWEAWRL